MLYIGSHVSYLKDKQLVGVVEESITYNSNIFMFYTGSNQSTLRFPVNTLLTKQAHELMEKNGFYKEKCIVHAPFIINLANYSSEIQMDLQMSQIRHLIQLEKLIETIFKISICLNQCSHQQILKEELFIVIKIQ